MAKRMPSQGRYICTASERGNVDIPLFISFCPIILTDTPTQETTVRTTIIHPSTTRRYSHHPVAKTLELARGISVQKTISRQTRKQLSLATQRSLHPQKHYDRNQQVKRVRNRTSSRTDKMSTRGSTGYSYYVPESRSSSHHDLTASDLSQEASSYMGRFGISATDGTRHFSVGDLQNSIRELEGLLQSFLALEVHGFLVPVYQEINKHCPGWNNGTSPSREQLNCQRSYLSALLLMTAQLHQTAQLYQGSRSTQTQMVGQTKREIQDIVKNLVTLTFNPDPRHADFTEESARSPLVGRTDSGYGSIASSILNSSARTNRTDRSASSLGCSSDSEDRVAKTSAMSSAGSENHQEPLKIKDLKQFWAYLDQMIKLVYIVIDRKIDLLSQVFSPPGVLDNWRRKRYESDRNKIYKLTCHDMEATRNWMNWLETRLECSSTPGDQPRGDCVEGSGIEGHVNRTKRYLAVMKNPGVPGERAYILRRPDPFNFDDSSVQAAVEFAANLYRDCQIDLRYYEAELKRICLDMSRHVEEDGASSDRSGVHPDDRLLETRYIDGQPSISRASFSSHPSSTDSHVGRSPTTRVTSDAVSSTLGSVSLGESLVRGYNHTVSTSWLRRQQKDRVKKDTEHRSAANGGVRTRLRQTLGGILGLNRKQYGKGQLHEKTGRTTIPRPSIRYQTSKHCQTPRTNVMFPFAPLLMASASTPVSYLHRYHDSPSSTRVKPD